MSELIIGGNGQQCISLESRLFNRHGFIAGATGTGKTVTLQVVIEQLSLKGVPTFVADIKGDLSGLGVAGKPHPKVQERLDYIGITGHPFSAMPVVFWDIHGELGHPLRTTISELGPLLLSNLLELNETQTGAVYACFREADQNGLLMLDLADFNAMLAYISEHSKELRSEYGNISSSTIGAIKRRLLILEEQGLSHFLGEPAVELKDLIQRSQDGSGMVNILDVTKLIQKSPRLYATVLIWLLSELFEELPEVGDQEDPKFVIFLDEAHLLFDKANASLVDKIEQVVRLVRSKGVGVFFISQNPLDLPDSVTGQLGLKIQHALRAFTPKDKKTLKATAENFRPNPNFDTLQVLPELATGEALISSLDLKGSPMPVEKTLIAPPRSKIGPIEPLKRQSIIESSCFYGHYDKRVDRESAYEMLKKRAQNTADSSEKDDSNTHSRPSSSRSSRRQSATETFFKSISRAIGSQLGRQIARGILGSLFKR